MKKFKLSYLIIMKKYLLILVAIFLVSNLYSQTVWKADVEEVKESGYYNIEVDQELIGTSKYNLRDLRLVKKDSVEIPYFIRSASPVQAVSSYENYKLKENTVRDSLNVIVVDNEARESLERFYVTIAGADVKINGSIRGSDDLKQWYIVKRESTISKYQGTDGDNMLILDFPKGKYRYYEITLANDQRSPLQVKSVDNIANSSIYGQFSSIPSMNRFELVNKDKNTIISFPDLQYAYVIAKVEFYINDKIGYLRNASLQDTVKHYNQYFTLSSKGDNMFFLEGGRFSAGGSVVMIENGDNPPLQIDSVRFYGLKRYICAYLEAGDKVQLKLDESVNTSPKYDIEHFKDEIAEDIPVLKTKNLSSVIIPEVRREQLLIENPIFMWSIIIGIGLLLTILCVKMLKGLKKEKS